MRNVRLVGQYNTIQSLIERTGTATGENIELQGHWGRYLCILAAGLLENSIREIYQEFVQNSASPPVASFASSRLRGINNPKSERFVQVASSFSQEWGQSLAEFLNASNGERKDAIDSIINNRNQIAHGRNTNIFVVRVKGYLDRVVEVIDFIESQCSER